MNRERVPRDPMILYSFINTKLRDYYSSLDILCDDMELERTDIELILSTVGFEYNQELNKFM